MGLKMQPAFECSLYSVSWLTFTVINLSESLFFPYQPQGSMEVLAVERLSRELCSLKFKNLLQA